MSHPPVLLIEGVTGAGKTSVAARLRAHPALADFVWIDEDETLGSLMDDVREPAWRSSPSLTTLERVLHRIEHLQQPVLVERFHPTWYALLCNWALFAPFDHRLTALGARLVLLSYPEAEISRRSLDRQERPGWAEGMAAWYGSRVLAHDAVSQSRRARLDVLELTSLPFLHIDTREAAWDRYVAAIVAWSCGDGRS